MGKKDWKTVWIAGKLVVDFMEWGYWEEGGMVRFYWRVEGHFGMMGMKGVMEGRTEGDADRGEEGHLCLCGGDDKHKFIDFISYNNEVIRSIAVAAERSQECHIEQ